MSLVQYQQGLPRLSAQLGRCSAAPGGGGRGGGPLQQGKAEVRGIHRHCFGVAAELLLQVPKLRLQVAGDVEAEDLGEAGHHSRHATDVDAQAV